MRTLGRIILALIVLLALAYVFASVFLVESIQVSLAGC